MPDTWTATLGNGLQFHEQSPELVGNRSPWRMLERLAADQAVTISEAQVILGARRVSLDAANGVLVCGQSADVSIDLASSAGHVVRYRWVCRQGERAWLWRLTDGIGAWEIETTPGIPGRERMPLPPVVAVAVPPPRPGEGAEGGRLQPGGEA